MQDMKRPTAPIRVIAEIGINHDGDAAVARRLIAAAAEAGVYGVKFQYRNPARVYGAGHREIGDEILKTEIERVHIPSDGLLDLAAAAHAAGLAAGLSVFAPEDLDDFGDGLAAFDFFKTPSVELDNHDLIDAIDARAAPALLSTGAHGEDVVQTTLARLDPARWTILHCVSNYPLEPFNAKLGYIRHLSRTWPGAVGYSSHDAHWEVCLLAIAMGATLIERHITHDVGAEGLDHSSSSVAADFHKLCAFARDFPFLAAGDGPRLANQGEALNLQNLGRSFYALAPIAAGAPLSEAPLALRCPRIGLAYGDRARIRAATAARAVPEGGVIDESCLTPPPTPSPEALSRARAAQIAIPVRFHDYAALSGRIPIGRFEFHLTYSDLAAGGDVATLDPDHRFSVHLPDYLSSRMLFDPFSPRPEQAEMSLATLEKTVVFVSALQDRTGAPTPVVGSFSMRHGALADFHAALAELLDGFRRRGVRVMPQWLPPIAWYFGGSVRLSVMNSPADAPHLLAQGTEICMDASHLCMGRGVFGFDPAALIAELAPVTGHVHIADAAGHDGEGLPIGEGLAENMPALRAALAFDCMKVLEVWQGHLNGGARFVRDLETVARLAPDG